MRWFPSEPFGRLSASLPTTETSSARSRRAGCPADIAGYLKPTSINFCSEQGLMKWQPAAITAPGLLEREARPREPQSRVPHAEAETQPFNESLGRDSFCKKRPFLGAHLTQRVCRVRVAASPPSAHVPGVSGQAAALDHGRPSGAPAAWAGLDAKTASPAAPAAALRHEGN